jgi:hypothetical protein
VVVSTRLVWSPVDESFSLFVFHSALHGVEAFTIPPRRDILMCLERAAKRSYKKLGRGGHFSMESFLFGLRTWYSW